LSKDELALEEVIVNDQPKVQRDEHDSQKSEEEQEEPAAKDDGVRLKVLCEKNLEY